MGFRDSPLVGKSYLFAVSIVRLVQTLQTDKREFILSKQLLRSGTSIGALIREAEFAQSDLDFIHKLSISLKEANETNYWLDLLHDTTYLSDDEFKEIKYKSDELVRLLVASIKTLKSKSLSKK